MDLARGFEIEDPPVVVPWGSTEDEVRLLLPSLREVTPGYLTGEVVSLRGLRHMLGFHFQPRNRGRLVELELYRSSYLDLQASFAEFQRHLEATFGPPQESRPAGDGFPAYGWKVGRTTIRHYVFDRFGPEEHVEVQLSRSRWPKIGKGAGPG
jgi:hypothetical protein